MNILYPKPIQKGDKIAISAFSSGVHEGMHHLVIKTKTYLEKLGYVVEIGETVWTQSKGRSASVEKRLNEFMNFWKDDSVAAIIPPWGGNFALDLIKAVDWVSLRETEPKWVLGYSDISTFNFMLSTKARIASAHGPNIIDLSFQEWDDVTKGWLGALTTKHGDVFEQHASEYYQINWPSSDTEEDVQFNLNQPTKWKCALPNRQSEFSGRLLGGCLNTIRNLIGTSQDHINSLIDETKFSEGIVWYLECTNMDTANVYQSLWQMREAGWFDNIKGVMFGRIDDCKQYQDFTIQQAFEDIFSEFDIPVLYDLDIGHFPPQMTLINGGFAEVVHSGDHGLVRTTLL